MGFAFRTAPRWENIACAWLVLLALLLSTFRLGSRPFTPTEAENAVTAWKVATGGTRALVDSPVREGLLPHYINALIVAAAGDSDFSARLGVVCFALAALAAVVALARPLGSGSAALAALILLTVSPTWLFFSRFLSGEMFLAPCLLASIYCVLRYRQSGRRELLYLAGVALGLAASTTAQFSLLFPLLVCCTVAAIPRGSSHGGGLFARCSPNEPVPARRIIVPGLTALLLACIVWLAVQSGCFTSSIRAEAFTFLLHPLEVSTGSGEAGGPWWFYLLRLVVYEPLIFCLAILEILTLPFRKPAVGRFERFLVSWATGISALYAVLPNKAPWLLVHHLPPLALLAAIRLCAFIKGGASRKIVALVPIAALWTFSLWSSIHLNFLRETAPNSQEGVAAGKVRSRFEILLPEQPTDDMIDKVVSRIEDIGRLLGTGVGTRVTVAGEAARPLRWYLRHYPVTWASMLSKIDTPVVVVDAHPTVTAPIDAAAGEAYERVPFRIRSIWRATPGAATLVSVLRFLYTRAPWGEIEGVGGMLYACKDLTATAACPVLRLSAPVITASVPAGPSLVPTVAVWGKPGSAPGEFNEPRDIAVDRWGNIYVADTRNHRIQKFDAAGRVIKSWGGEGNGPGQFKEPCGVAVGPDGTVYVADTWNHRIQRFDRNGAFVRQWTENDPPLWGPRGIVVAPDGTVFVTDTGNKRVLAYSADGHRLRVWGGEGSEPGRFIEPVGIAMDAAGRVVVADTGNRRLQFFRPDGTFLEAWPVSGWEAFYTEPYVDTEGHDVYVTDSTTNRFVRYRDGKPDRAWSGTEGEGNALNRPIGIAVGGPGIVYVSDTFNHRLRRFLVE